MRVVLSDRYKERYSIAFDEDDYELVCDAEVNTVLEPFTYEDHGSDNGQDVPYEYTYIVEVDSDKPVNIRQDLLLGYGTYAGTGIIDDQVYRSIPSSYAWTTDTRSIKFGCGIGDKNSTANLDPFSTYIYGARYSSEMFTTDFILIIPFVPADKRINIYAFNLLRGDYFANQGIGIASKIFISKSDDETKARVRVWRKIGEIATVRG